MARRKKKYFYLVSCSVNRHGSGYLFHRSAMVEMGAEITDEPHLKTAVDLVVQKRDLKGMVVEPMGYQLMRIE